MNIRPLGKLGLIVFLLLAANRLAWTECTVREERYRNFPALVLENEFVRVTLVPGFGGRIAEYVLKPSAVNQLLPLEMEKKQVMPGVSKTLTNNGGFEDRFWDRTTPNNISPYQTTVLEKGPARILVKLSWENEDQKIERTVSLSAGNAELQLDVKITNKSAQPASWQYWAQAMVQVGGDFAPKGSDWMYTAIRTSKAGAKEVSGPRVRRVLIIPGHLFPWETPAQDWIAVLDRDKMTALGVVAPNEELAPDGFHYVWCGATFANPNLAWPADDEARSKFMAIHEVYGTRTVAAGAAQSYHCSIIGFQGVKDLDYVSRHIALDVELPDSRPAAVRGAIPITGTLVPSTAMEGTFTLMLVNSGGDTKASLDFALVDVSPLRPLRLDGAFNPKNLNPGRYRMKGAVRGKDGQPKEEFDLLLPEIEVGEGGTL